MPRALNSLFFLLGLAAAFSPLEEMARFAEYRSPVLASLGDFGLTDEEALARVSSRVNSNLGIPDSPQNQDYWIQLLSGKTKYVAPANPHGDLKDHLLTTLNSGAAQLLDKVQAMAKDPTFAGKHAQLEEAQQAAAFEGFRALAAHLAALIGPGLSDDLKRQFADNLNSNGEKKRLEARRAVANDVYGALVDQMNVFIETLNLDITEEFSDEIMAVVLAPVQNINEQVAQMGQVLSLVSNGAYMLQIEAQSAFFAAQHFSEVPAAARLSRLALVARLLTLFAHLNHSMDHLEQFIITVHKHRRALLRGDFPEDLAFAPLFRGFLREFLKIVREQVGTEESFNLGKRFLSVSQEVKQNHLVPFLKAAAAKSGLPHMPPAGGAASSRHILRIVAHVTALSFADITAEWWEQVAAGFDRLLEADPNTVNVLGYATLQFSEGITPAAGHEEFLEAYFAVLLEFLEANGSRVDPETYFKYLSQFLDLTAGSSPVRQKFYLLFKLQNVYAAPKKEVFDVKFLDFCGSTDAAAALGKLATDGNFDTLLKVAWNGFVKATGSNKSSAKRAFNHLSEWSGKTVSSEVFPHANFQFSVDESARQKRPAQFVDVEVKVTSGSPAGPLKQKTPKEQTPNKIVIDSGKEPELTPEEQKLVDALARNLPKLTRENSIKVEDLPAEEGSPQLGPKEEAIPNPKLEEMVQEQIKDNKAAEHIEQQVTDILEGKEPAQEVVEKKEESADSLPGTKVSEIAGDLTPAERKLLEQPNLRELLGQVAEITDDDGNVTKFAYVKLVPKMSDCYKTLFG